MKNLINAAKTAMENAYAPYSGFRVGAALLCADGSVYTGCNVENAAYGATNCAERTAIFKAVSEGKRDFTAIAICGGKEGHITHICPPCGTCRQVMGEFCGDDFAVYLQGEEGNIQKYTLGELLPSRFGLENCCE